MTVDEAYGKHQEGSLIPAMRSSTGWQNTGRALTRTCLLRETGFGLRMQISDNGTSISMFGNRANAP